MPGATKATVTTVLKSTLSSSALRHHVNAPRDVLTTVNIFVYSICEEECFHLTGLRFYRNCRVETSICKAVLMNVEDYANLGAHPRLYEIIWPWQQRPTKVNNERTGVNSVSSCISRSRGRSDKLVVTVRAGDQKMLLAHCCKSCS